MEAAAQRAQLPSKVGPGPALRALDAMPDRDWAAVVGHELRNPLASALASAHLVAAWTEPGDPRAEAAQRVIHDLERSAALLDRYIALGRTGRMERRVFAFGAWLRGFLADAAREGGIEILCRSSVDVPVCGDRMLLERALENLLQNACRAGATRWEVTARISTTPAGDELSLRLVDDGAGVPAPLHDSLFSAGVTGGGGSGLGLSIVRDILSAHGGTIEFVPTVLVGACFELRLPVARNISAAEA